MSSLHKVVAKNLYKMKTVEGSTFEGQFTDIPVTTRVSNFNSARRLLRVLPNSILKIGGNFYDPNGQVFLVAEHGDQFLKGRHLYTHYKLFEMHHTAAIGTKGSKSVHPVTGLKIESPAVWTQGIYLAFEMRSTGTDAIGIGIKKQQIITGHPIKEGDLIHIFGYDKQAVVERVDEQLGVFIGQIEYE